MREIRKVETNESPPKVVKNLFNKDEINQFLKLYENLPTTVHNKKQNVVKKRWLQGYDKELEKKFIKELKMKLVILNWII